MTPPEKPSSSGLLLSLSSSDSVSLSDRVSFSDRVAAGLFSDLPCLPAPDPPPPPPPFVPLPSDGPVPPEPSDSETPDPPLPVAFPERTPAPNSGTALERPPRGLSARRPAASLRVRWRGN